MAVIPLALADMDEAAVVMRRSYDAALPWLAGRHGPAEDRWFFRNVVFPSCRVHGATLAGRLVGVIAFRDGWIEQLYVLPERQRCGAGSRLLASVLRPGQPVELWTFRRNLASRAFYERHGFVAVEETDGSRNEEREPDVRYIWDGGR